MKRSCKQKLSLDRPATYQIEVPRVLDASWSDWFIEMRLSVDYDSEGLPRSTLTGTLDQAALHSLLRRLYSLGFPLISVNWVDVE